MKNRKLPFRQVHLDFHTSPFVPGVGSKFDKKQFQDALKAGHVNSITVFSKCHHGMTYHPTECGKMHPTLNGFNLLGAQIEACKEIGVAAPVYISAGYDEYIGREHPEWCVTYGGHAHDFAQAGFFLMCFRSPYLDYLCAQIREVCRLFPNADGIFLDIISPHKCTCKYCLKYMEERGLDWTKESDVEIAAQETLENYYRKTTEAAHVLDPDMPIFHNSGNVGPKFKNRLDYFSHLELESLPTGGWGYDHYPMSIKYVSHFGKDCLGMTGKFHLSWGEFGGFKHPNALRYECDAMLAFGSKCSVGDQCHPDGEMDMGTYNLIGEAYADVEKKEPWCDNVENVAEIGVIQECAQPNCPAEAATYADIGVGRVLLESHLLFDMIDNDCDFSKYKLIVVSDGVVICDDLKKKLDAYVAAGGKLLLSGSAGLNAERTKFLFDVGAETDGRAEIYPDYTLPKAEYRASYMSTPVVMYAREEEKSQRIKVTDGESLGDVYYGYFARDAHHFCSHRHTPNLPEPSGYACGVRKGNVAYLAHSVFSLYSYIGMVCHREYAIKVIRSLLGESKVEVEGLPSSGRVSLMRQPAEGRDVLHLLYAPTMKRGGYGGRDVEVVEDLVPLHDVKVQYRSASPVKSVRIVPEGVGVDFKQGADGVVSFTIPRFECHCMVEIK